MKTNHAYAIAAVVGLGIGFFLLTGANTYGAGVWGATYFGPFYTTGNQLGAKL